MESKMPKPAVDKTPSTVEKSPDLLAQTHIRFEEAGSYGAADLQKILGDPRRSVDVPMTGALPKSAVFARKK